MILSRAFGAVLFALAAACSDGGGDSLPTSPTSPVPRACTVTLTGEHTGWAEPYNDRDSGTYIPLYDLRFRCSGGEGLTKIWLVIRLWAGGEFHSDAQGTIPIRSGEERWECYEGAGEPAQDDGCAFHNGTHLPKGVSFRWRATWNVCHERDVECAGYPDPPQ